MRSTGLEPALLSVEDAARYLGVGRTTVYVMRRTGELSFVRVRGRSLVERAALERYIAERRQPSDEGVA